MDNWPEYEFNVTICLDGGDGGDVSVSVPVSMDELNLIKDCYRNYRDIESETGLEDLVKRIEESAAEENEMLMDEYSPEVQW